MDGRGVAGRIGGDEYACVIECGDSEREEQGFVDRITERFVSFNETSDKAYNITVSVGIYRMDASSNESLSDALSHADESLYEAKKHRVKEVAKWM